MRVTHIIKTNGIAGAERHLLILLPGLVQRGFTVRVIFIAPTTGEGSDFAAAVEATGIPVDRVPIRGSGSPALSWRLRTVLRRHKPHLAHAHLFHAEVLGLPAARAARVPRVFISRHNEDTRPGRTLLRHVYRGLWRMTDTGICISHAVRRAVEAQGAPPERLRVVHYGLPPTPQPNREEARRQILELAGFGAKGMTFGIVSRLIALKGVDDAIRALAQMKATSARLVIAGDGPQRSHLEDEAQRLGVADRVAFIGWQPEGLGVMAGLDALLSPSHKEGFGMSVVEAMSQGTPVIASDAGALPEVVSDGETGLLVPARDPAALATALDELTNDPQARERMGAAGRRRVEDLFSAERMLSATASLYEAAPPPH